MEDFKTPNNLPERSELEEKLDRKFSDLEIDTEEDLNAAIHNTFEEICGTNGKEEFDNFVLPTIKKIYGTNYRKAGVKLLDIIDAGADKPVGKIGEYFKSAAERIEKTLSVDRPERLKKVTEKIEGAILKKKEQYGEDYDGVVAAIIFGSYAKNTFTAESDLDIFFVTFAKEKGFELSQDKYVDYDDDFEATIQRELGRKLKIDNQRGCSIQNEGGLREVTFSKEGIVGGNYIIVTPYSEIKSKIEEILSNH